MMAKARLALRMAGRAGYIAESFTAMRRQSAGAVETHLTLTAEALELARIHSRDGGYAVSYSLMHGWSRGYVETTGYIIPTTLDLARRLERPDLAEQALAQGPWLLDHQNPDGGFPGIDRKESYVFDTGQVLIGLHRLLKETNDKRYEAAARRACDWLCDIQDETGGWRPTAAPGPVTPTYMTRVAAALLRFGQSLGVARYEAAARRCLEWASGQRLPSGLYDHSQLHAGEPYLLHTIVYVLEGFLDAWRLTGEQRWFDAALAGAEPLKTASLEREPVLRAYYNADLTPATNEKCITGLAQWAGVALAFHEAGLGEDWLDSASNALFYVASKQLQTTDHLRGALPGSVPFWGAYEKWAFPNWGLKFFADSLLAFEKTGVGPNRQQEIWVRTAHQIYGQRAGWASASRNLDPFDQALMGQIEAIIAGEGAESPRVIDLGCGEGRCLAWLAERRPNWRLEGVDPLPPTAPLAEVMPGSALAMPQADGSADAIFTTIALQHVADLPAALGEARRVLKPGGLMIIFDRDLISIRGFLKRWHELKGRWIYEWDSPFRESWHTRSGWRRILQKAGFEVAGARGLVHKTGRGLKARLPVNKFVLVWGRKAKG